MDKRGSGQRLDFVRAFAGLKERASVVVAAARSGRQGIMGVCLPYYDAYPTLGSY